MMNIISEHVSYITGYIDKFLIPHSAIDLQNTNTFTRPPGLNAFHTFTDKLTYKLTKHKHIYVPPGRVNAFSYFYW